MSAMIGFIGLGIMGQGMAENLVTKANRKLVVWNRSPNKGKEFCAKHGDCRSVATPAEVVESCEIIYLMLSDLHASNCVYKGENGILSADLKGKKLIDCATLTAEHMMELENLVIAKGGTFLEAPVSGSKVPAATGTLIFLCGGSKPLFEEVSGDLAVMGKASHFFGATGAGSRMKIIVNMMMGVIVNSLAEGLALCDAAGLPQDELLAVLDEGALANPIYKLKGPKMIKGDHDAHFPLKHQQKDMRFAVELGDSLGVALPVVAAANEQFKRARPEFGDEDMSAVYKVAKKSEK